MLLFILAAVTLSIVTVDIFDPSYFISDGVFESLTLAQLGFVGAIARSVWGSADFANELLRSG